MAAVATKIRPAVFLTSSAADSDVAEQMATLLNAIGLEVIRLNGMATSGVLEDYLRDAIRRSSAVVVVLSRATTSSRIPASIMFEIGAAAGAHKPVFVIVEDPSVHLGFSVPDMHVLPISRADEVGQIVSGLGN